MSRIRTEFVKPGGLDLKDRLVSIQRVTKVTKGGRAFGFSAIVVVGDENGVVGHGLGKAKEVSIAISKAVEDAKKNLVRIPLYNSTIPHEQKGKHGGARVYMQPASQGTGVIAGGAVRAVLESVGIQDVLSKSQGSSNPHNVVKATFDALFKLRDANKVAQERGITLEKLFKVKIKQTRSKINRPVDQKRTLEALGLKKIGQVVEHEMTPSIEGMINKVKHLITIVE
jgi:small subunit ribosomal protein S5